MTRTSKEAVLELIKLLKENHYQIVNKDVEVLTIKGYPLNRIVKDLELLEKIKHLYYSWQNDLLTNLGFIIRIREVFKNDE